MLQRAIRARERAKRKRRKASSSVAFLERSATTAEATRFRNHCDREKRKSAAHVAATSWLRKREGPCQEIVSF